MARCCQAAAVPETPLTADAASCSSTRNRSLSVLGWILPATVLALMPKCPVCVAAYAAALTGIGLSLPAASYLRTTAIAISVASLLAMSVIYVMAFHRRSLTVDDRQGTRTRYR